MLQPTWQWILPSLLLAWMLFVINCQEVHDGMDILQPYLYHHGPYHRTHRETREICQSVKYGNVAHSLHKAYENTSMNIPVVDVHRLTRQNGIYWDKKFLFVLHQVVANPLSTLSIKEPGYFGSCLNESGIKATVRETARQHNCVYASNAGYFNTHNGHCLGNVVSDGKYVHNSGGVQNAHFGITGDGRLFTGYLSELDYLALEFKQLVGGVIWLVRDGEDYVEQSIKVECSDTEETGTLERFVNVVSARTAIGHDKDGKVHIVQVNGLTDKAGVDLHEFAKLLIDLGITNAINLDGGGSATSILNDTLINYPSDKCSEKVNSCERAISTIVCVHYPACPVADCSNHGTCVQGKCHCQSPWVGDGCQEVDKLRCGSHGAWVNGGCECEPGWHGSNCSQPCAPGWYGKNCAHQCVCGNHGDCHIKTGHCTCHAGYIGKFCQKKCPYGYYGLDCIDVCFCRDSCFCDHVTGSCNITHIHSDYLKAGECLVNRAIKKDDLVPDRHEQYSLCISSVACLCVIATASLILNAVFTYMLVKLKRVNAAFNNNTIESIELAARPKSKQDTKRRLKRRKKRVRDPSKNGHHYSALNGGLGAWRREGGVASGTSADRSLFGSVKREEGNGGKGVGIDSDVTTVTGSGEDENDSFLSRKKGET